MKRFMPAGLSSRSESTLRSLSRARDATAASRAGMPKGGCSTATWCGSTAGPPMPSAVGRPGGRPRSESPQPVAPHWPRSTWKMRTPSPSPSLRWITNPKRKLTIGITSGELARIGAGRRSGGLVDGHRPHGCRWPTTRSSARLLSAADPVHPQIEPQAGSPGTRPGESFASAHQSATLASSPLARRGTGPPARRVALLPHHAARVTESGDG